jgi:serine protease
MRLSLLFIVALAAAPAGAAQPAPLIVRYRTSRSSTAMGRVRRQLWPDTQLLEVADPDRALAALRADPDVLYAEPDRVRQRASARMPNDPMFPLQWGLPLVRAPEAWTRTTGATTVTVAIVDTGLRLHPDLQDRILPGYDFISNPANAGDGDGRDPDPSDPGSADPSSSELHGLHVAGIVGAVSDNGIGVTGLDWACRLLPVRALGVERGTGVDSDIADAIRWAAGLHVDGVPDNAHPADVINLSFGGEGKSETLQRAVDAAVARGAVVVAAAGNRAVDARNDAPGGLDGVIAVGGVDPRGRLTAYSNFGPAVALVAPGGVLDSDPSGHAEGVLSTLELPGSGFTYAYYAGTSQAAAFVSATVALMKSVAPSLTPAAARAVLLASADASRRCASPGAPASPGCGAGLVDAARAVELAAAQSACPACAAGKLCQDGSCRRVEGLPVDGTELRGGGCRVAAGGGDLMAALLVLAVLAGRARARRFDGVWRIR